MAISDAVCKLGKTGRSVRPRVRWQWEEKDETLGALGQLLRALPPPAPNVLYAP